ALRDVPRRARCGRSRLETEGLTNGYQRAACRHSGDRNPGGARAPGCRARGRSSGRLGPTHVEEGALVGRALAEIAEPIAAQEVDRAGQRLARRPLPRHQDDSRSNLVGYAEPHAHRAEVIEELDPVL